MWSPMDSDFKSTDGICMDASRCTPQFISIGTSEGSTPGRMSASTTTSPSTRRGKCRGSACSTSSFHIAAAGVHRFQGHGVGTRGPEFSGSDRGIQPHKTAASDVPRFLGGLAWLLRRVVLMGDAQALNGRAGDPAAFISYFEI